MAWHRNTHPAKQLSNFLLLHQTAHPLPSNDPRRHRLALRLRPALVLHPSHLKRRRRSTHHFGRGLPYLFWHRPRQNVHLFNAVPHRDQKMAAVDAGVCGRDGADYKVSGVRVHLRVVSARGQEVQSDCGGDLLGDEGFDIVLEFFEL